MKIVLILSILILVLGFVKADILINEIEFNPIGTDSGNEWLELYSNSFVNLTNWEISSSNGRSMIFNASFTDYYVINTTTNLLTNTNNILYLKNNSGFIIFSTNNLTDSLDDNRTWQYCNGNWKFLSSTFKTINNCIDDSNSASTENQANNNPENIDLDLSWTNKDIINNKEFYITLEASNLEDLDYDVKVWLESDEKDLELKSETYDKNSGEWKSSNYFIEKFLSGEGNKDKDIKIRIKDGYSGYVGDAIIYFKLRETDSGNTIGTISNLIKILKGEENSTEEIYIPDTIESDSINSEEISTIILNSKTNQTEDIKMPENSIYLSRTEQIKKYAPYVFIVLCIFLLVLVIIDSNKRRK